MLVVGYLAGAYILTQAFLRPGRPPKGMETPHAFGLAYETWPVPGSRVPAWYFPGGQDGNAAPFTVVLVPAIGGTVFTLQTESLGPFIRRLHDDGLAVVSVPGFQPRHVSAVLDAVRDRGLRRPVLLGFSIGGSTALFVARTVSVAALVLDGVVDDLGRVLWRDLRRQGPIVRLLLPGMRLFATLHRGVSQALHAADSLPAVSAPVLLVYGEREYLVEAGMNRRLLAQVAQRPDADVFTVPETGHCYGPSDHPDLYARRVLAFLTAASP